MRWQDWSSPPAWQQEVEEQQALWNQTLDIDLAPRPNEAMSQAEVLKVLNDFTTKEDVLVVASGTPHVEVHKIWEPADSARVLMEVGFSCMGHELPASLGVRLARGAHGQVYAFIGDGTYLMGVSELATAVQERLKVTLIVSENHGFQSIHGLQRRTTASSFGLEFREDRLRGSFIAIDYAANARSFGCVAFDASTLEEFRDALAQAARETCPTVIVTHVDPLRQVIDGQCWWDVGITEVSERPQMNEVAAAHLEYRSEHQRYRG